MSNEFWLGAYFGFLAGGLVILVPLLWWLNRQFFQRLEEISKELSREH